MSSQSFDLIHLKQIAESGRAADIDDLMRKLDQNESFAGYKLIDYALGLVTSAEGRDRLRHFLFNGSPVQRNYAALYFKRRGSQELLDEAVRRGCIDAVQAYLR